MQIKIEATEEDLIMWHPVGDEDIDAEIGVSWNLRDDLGILADNVEVLGMKGYNVILRDEFDRTFRVDLKQHV